MVIFGELLLWVALVLSGLVVWLGYSQRDHDDKKIAARRLQKTAVQMMEMRGRRLGQWVMAIFFLVAGSFGCLIYLFITDNFSVWLVVQHSHRAMPLLYKLGAAWGNHEGSMLLWIVVLSAMSQPLLFLARRYGVMGHAITHRTLATQHGLLFLFLGFLLFTSNPFLRLFPVPADGFGLNPLLQDPGLLFHPPFLYGGFVGLSVLFSLAMGALLSRIIDKRFIRIWRFFILAAWIFLTAGIIGGSFWAYYELGWGGFWFWDPVENISLVPWLLVTALLHSVMVFEKTGQLMASTILLSLLAFGSSMVGTFLVRSGVITSVHSFAADPARGLYILFIIALSLAAAVYLFLRAVPRFWQVGPPPIFTRAGLLVFNNALLIILAAIVFFGTVYPLIALTLGGVQITVGAPFFNIATLPFFALLFLLLGLGFFLPIANNGTNHHYRWRKNIIIAWSRIKNLLWAAMAIAFATAIMVAEKFFIVFFGGGLALLLVFSAFKDAVTKYRAGNLWLVLRRGQLAAPLAHGALGLMIIGIIGTTQLSQQMNIRLMAGQQFIFANNHMLVDKIYLVDKPSYKSLVVRLISDAGWVLAPEKRIYKPGGQESSDIAIVYRPWVNYYAAVGEINPDNQSLMIRLYRQPLAMFIFIGGLLLAVAGLLAMVTFLWRDRPSADKGRR